MVGLRGGSVGEMEGGNGMCEKGRNKSTMDKIKIRHLGSFAGDHLLEDLEEFGFGNLPI